MVTELGWDIIYQAIRTGHYLHLSTVASTWLYDPRLRWVGPKWLLTFPRLLSFAVLSTEGKQKSSPLSHQPLVFASFALILPLFLSHLFSLFFYFRQAAMFIQILVLSFPVLCAWKCDLERQVSEMLPRSKWVYLRCTFLFTWILIQSYLVERTRSLWEKSCTDSLSFALHCPYFLFLGIHL